MDKTLLNDKKINLAVFVFVIVISLLVVAKIVNEVKTSYFIGRGNQPANTISVEGSGEVVAVSDVAKLNLNLSKDGSTAKQVTKTLEYLKGKSIEDKDIKSEYGGLSPKYSYDKCYTYPCPTNPKIVGYTATQSITVKILDVDSANDTRTGLAELGITDITGPTFGIDDEENYQNEARSKAIAEARARAEVLAGDLGVKLGKVVSFYENGDNNYPMYAKTMSAGAMDSTVESAPVLPKGENKITSNVTVIYEIK